MSEDEMIGWHHQLNGYEFEQALGVGDRQGGWRAAVHGVTKSWTQLREEHFHFQLTLQIKSVPGTKGQTLGVDSTAFKGP